MPLVIFHRRINDSRMVTMKASIIFLLCLSAALGAAILRQWIIISDRDAQLSATSAKLSEAELKITAINSEKNRPDDQPKEASLEVQSKCAEHAYKTFVRKGFISDDTSYISHFNSTLKKCFIVTRSLYISKEGSAISHQLFDAIEGKQYGNFAIYVPVSRKQEEIKPIDCYVLKIKGGFFVCKNEPDFSAMVLAYMED